MRCCISRTHHCRKPKGTDSTQYDPSVNHHFSSRDKIPKSNGPNDIWLGPCSSALTRYASHKTDRVFFRVTPNSSRTLEVIAQIFQYLPLGGATTNQFMNGRGKIVLPTGSVRGIFFGFDINVIHVVWLTANNKANHHCSFARDSLSTWINRDASSEAV